MPVSDTDARRVYLPCQCMLPEHFVYLAFYPQCNTAPGDESECPDGELSVAFAVHPHTWRQRLRFAWRVLRRGDLGVSLCDVVMSRATAIQARDALQEFVEHVDSAREKFSARFVDEAPTP